MCFIGPTQAIEPVNPTPKVVGHLPVLSPLSLPVGSVAADAAATGATKPVSDHAKVGVALTLADMGLDLSLLVTDADGDIENGSLYEWLIDNAVVGTAASFTPSVAHGGQLLSVRVIPKTQTGDPNTGKVVTSNAIVVRSALIDQFTKPDKTIRTWSSANTYCQNLGGGYRLPTRAELQQLFQEVTSGNGYQLCERYGWPLGGGGCGGSKSFYWTSEPSTSGYHWLVSMNSGFASSNGSVPTSTAQVTCVR